MMQIKVDDLSKFARATKTKPILAAPVEHCIADQLVAALLLQTPEGQIPLRPGSMICMGAGREFWSQDPQKLLAKYTLVGFNEKGWGTYNPKPDNEVYVRQITSEDSGIIDSTSFFIEAQWGERYHDTFIQKGEIGDYVCRSVTDMGDRWIVKKNLFEATYEILPAVTA